MRPVRYIPDTPEKAIALDEILLKRAEEGRLGETLRFWQAKDHFVVIGRAGRTSEDCLIPECRRDGVKIIRRVSGGGTVLQGPGCLNYSLVLSYERGDGYRDVNASYRLVLGKIAEGLRRAGHDVDHLPVSDLTLGQKKISGNAQARKKRYFLHHGTVLFDLDISRMDSYLKHPAREPEYRHGRAHSDFVTNVPAGAGELEGIISDVFRSSEEPWEPHPEDLEELDELVSVKYSRESWNYSF